MRRIVRCRSFTVKIVGKSGKVVGVKVNKQQVEGLVEKLWPAGCLEDGDNDPQTRYLDGYCNGLRRMAKEIIRLIDKERKELSNARV